MYGDERYASNYTILFPIISLPCRIYLNNSSYTHPTSLFISRSVLFTSLEISKGNQETGRDKLSLRKRGPWSIFEIARLVSRGNDSEG